MAVGGDVVFIGGGWKGVVAWVGWWELRGIMKFGVWLASR